MRATGLMAAIPLISWMSAAPLYAEAALHDPSLPSVAPQGLQQLSETQIRQKIMLESQTPYHSRCVCPYQTRDDRGRSCKGRHEVVRSPPQPICYPNQVTRVMIDDWHRRQASQ